LFARAEIMNIRHFPDESTVQTAMDNDDPLTVMVAYDGSELLIANIDDVMEHTILLRKLGRSDAMVDRYFRIVLNRSGADWTFVCPSDYRGIADRAKRIEAYYNDGVVVISKAIETLGYQVPITIPQRYRRHWNTLSN
jgi:hypothetical protein